MAAESAGGNDICLYKAEGDAAQSPMDDPNAMAWVDDTEARYHRQDKAVAEALDSLQAVLQSQGAIPDGVGFLFCHDPAVYGITYEHLAALEGRAYEGSNYGERVEGEALFADEAIFRGYNEHGPLRFVLVVTGQNEALQALAYFAYFEVPEHCGPAYTVAAVDWEARTGLKPAICIVSKLVADPNIPRAAAALPGRTVAATLQALANTEPKAGFYFEAQAQPATQRFVASHLKRRYIPDLTVLLNEISDDMRYASRPPTMLLIHVPPQIQMQE